MLKNNILSILLIGILYSLFILGCTPSSYTLRYKDNSGINTYEDSLKTGLIKEERDDFFYYSQVQDTSSEFQDWESEEEDSSFAENDLDIQSLLKRLNTTSNSRDSGFSNSTPRERMLMEIIKYINTPYKFGGDSQDGIDCSAFTQNVFNSSLNIPLFRSAREQFTQGLTIKEKEDLIFGDLVFFNTRRRVRPGHVGIYIGDRLFAHASSVNGVIVSSIDHEYYSKRFMGARRVDKLFSEN